MQRARRLTMTSPRTVGADAGAPIDTGGPSGSRSGGTFTSRTSPQIGSDRVSRHETCDGCRSEAEFGRTESSRRPIPRPRRKRRVGSRRTTSTRAGRGPKRRAEFAHLRILRPLLLPSRPARSSGGDSPATSRSHRRARGRRLRRCARPGVRPRFPHASGSCRGSCIRCWGIITRQLDAIRLRCVELYDGTACPGGYCGPDGVTEMRRMVEGLRRET